MKKTMIFFFLTCHAYADSVISKQNQATLHKTFTLFWDNALAITITFIFLSALIGFFLKARAVDKCLKDFRNYNVTVEYGKEQLVTGKFNLYPTGMELEFKEPQIEGQDNYYSHILYKNEYTGLHMIYRYQDALTPENARNREKDIKRTYNPGVIRRLRRSLRNIMGTFRDAFVQSMGLLIGHMKKTSPSKVLQSQEKQIKNIGEEIIGTTGSVYDPILEKYIGYRVIVEVEKDGKIESYCGIFKEYTPHFIEILNVRLSEQFTTENVEEYSPLQISSVKKGFSVKNIANFPLYLQKVEQNTKSKEINQLLEAGKEMDVSFSEKSQGNTTICALRQVDIIIPRAKAIIRHAADRKREDWRSLIKFDL